jgi:thiol-disulfide isomerase/thioredoxin
MFTDHAMKRSSLLPLLALLCAGTLHAAGQSTISGRVVGADGRPMPKADVHLLYDGGRRPFASAEVAPDGSFTISTDRTGVLELQVTGVNHASYSVPLLIETPRAITLDVRLVPHATGTSFDDIRIIGDFNDFDFDSGKQLAKGKNGTYSITLKTPLKSFSYQILFPGAPGGTFSMNGTQSDSYVYDGGGDYRSVVAAKNGSVTITFDPGKLQVADAPPSVTYRDSVTARVARAMNDIETHRFIHSRSMAKASRPQNDNGAEGMTEVLDRAKKETDPLVRNILLLEYLDLANQGGGPADPEISRRVLGDVAPGSPLWYDPTLLDAAIAASGEPGKYAEYRWRVVESRPDTSMRTAFLYGGLASASQAGDEALVNTYYDYLQAHYPKTSVGEIVRSEYDPNRSIKPGKSVPAFSVASIDAPAKTYSNETMKGHYYMIDFWATWCGPCVGEMPNIHKAYDRFHGRNFEILSLSFDARPEDVARFRKGKWKMPWEHAFVEGSFRSDLAKRFEVVGIPKPVLVDGNGTIVAAGEQLRGEALEQTLERVLGTPN